MLPAHFCSFGEKGCWQSNRTLGENFMTTGRTISRMIGNLKKYIWVKKPKGYYRTIWVKFHPDLSFLNSRNEHRQNCPTELDKTRISSRTKPAVRPGQNCPTTYTHTNKENYKETAVDLPMPASGQASQLLIERKAKMMADIGAFKRQFGNGRVFLSSV